MAPAAAPPVDLELVQRSWEAIRAAVKQRKRSLDSWLMMARPVGLRDGVLALEFRSGYGFHADNCAREDSRALLAEVFQEVLGVPLRVDCTVAASDEPPAAVADDGASLHEQADEVLESEAAFAAGAVPDDARAHELAIETLTRDLGATIVEDER
ncbi:MAG: hypothetical protein M3O86_04485 [Actinomycetota bacterium]|nr:hypothetical protein [Actinomycetota bacterium]